MCSTLVYLSIGECASGCGDGGLVELRIIARVGQPQNSSHRIKLDKFEKPRGTLWYSVTGYNRRVTKKNEQRLAKEGMTLDYDKD